VVPVINQPFAQNEDARVVLHHLVAGSEMKLPSANHMVAPHLLVEDTGLPEVVDYQVDCRVRLWELAF
jgi:hypothetical protein